MNRQTRALVAALAFGFGFVSAGPAAVAADLEKTKPENVGLSSDRLARVDAVVKSYIDAGQLTGAVVAVARSNKIVHEKSYGKLDADSGAAMPQDAIFRIASMTKPITSVGIMILVEEGKLLLADPISKYIPEFKDAKVMVPRDPADASKGYDTVPAKREITIIDLLAHTSGISYRFWGRPVAALYEEAGVHDGLEPTAGTIGEGMRKLAKLPLAIQPGSAYEYGLNTDLLGYLIEVVSGMPLDQFFKTKIFDPLGMKNTQFYISEAQRAKLAGMLVPDGKGGMMKAPEQPTRWGALVFSPGVPYAANRTYFSGGGGLSSTAPDYLRFCQMLLNGGRLDNVRILGPKSVERMSSNAIGSLSVWDVYSPAAIGNLGDKFGLGFGIKSEAGQNELGSVGEYMWAGIFNTRFWIDPKEKIAIVFLGQRIPRAPEIEAKVHNAVYQAIER
jgi:CubicO group peptidase (beta-lactamase class C family)